MRGSRPAAFLFILISIPGLAGARASAGPDVQNLLQNAVERIQANDLKGALKLSDTALAQATSHDDGEEIAAAQFARTMALEFLDRPEEARAAAIASIERTGEPERGAALLTFLGEGGDRPTQLAVLDVYLSRFGYRIRDLDVKSTTRLLPWVMKEKGEAVADALRLRLADGGFGGDDIALRDWFTLGAARTAIEAGDPEHARKLADTIVLRSVAIAALTDRRFEAIWPALEQSAGPNMERIARAAVIDAEGAAKTDRSAIAATKSLLQAYQEAGRFADAHALAAPFMTRAEDLADIDEDGGWLIDGHALTLVSMGRIDDADARMAALTVLPIAEHPWLISMIINRAEILVSRGRTEKGLALSEEAGTLAQTYGSPYARQLTRRLRICALEKLGRTAEAEALAPDLAAHARDSMGATIDGYYCLGRDADAEALALEVLGDAGAAMTIVETIQPEAASLGQGDPSLWTTFAGKLRGNPRVMEAVGKVGRLLPERLWPTPVTP